MCWPNILARGQTVKRFIILLTVLTLLIPLVSAIEPTADTTSTNTGFASEYTHSHTIGAEANILLVAIGMADATSTKKVDTVTFNGLPLTRLREEVTSVRSDIWYLTNPPVGSHDVFVDILGSQKNKVLIGAISWKDSDPTDPFGENKTSSGTGTAASITINSNDDSRVFDWVVTGESGSITPNPGQTERFNGQMQTSTTLAGGSTEPGATTTTMGWVLGSSKPWLVIGVSIHGDEAGPSFFNASTFPPTVAQNEPVNISANIIDGNGIFGVNANITLPDGSVVTVPLNNITGTFFLGNFTANSTNPLGRYNVTVFAIDQFNNTNFVTTYFFVDNKPPEVTNPTTKPGSAAPGSIINISATITDDFQVDKAFANVTLPNGTTITLNLVQSPATTYSRLFTQTGEQGAYYVLFIANDSACQV